MLRWLSSRGGLDVEGGERGRMRMGEWRRYDMTAPLRVDEGGGVDWHYYSHICKMG